MGISLTVISHYGSSFDTLVNQTWQGQKEIDWSQLMKEPNKKGSIGRSPSPRIILGIQSSDVLQRKSLLLPIILPIICKFYYISFSPSCQATHVALHIIPIRQQHSTLCPCFVLPLGIIYHLITQCIFCYQLPYLIIYQFPIFTPGNHLPMSVEELPF